PEESFFEEFQADLRANLAADPSFSGPWVHSLCESTYGVLFRFTEMDTSSGNVKVRDTECVAGLASMASVCAQSVALRGRGRGRWQWHPSVVEDEGPSIGDAYGKVPLAECLSLC
ncbi:unnamed protein product, partial [Polarella glacialis]